MKTLSKPFKALWVGEIISEFGGAAGGIINGLLLYELTGSKEWMGIMWLVYFIPSLILQGMSAPFLNHVKKEKMLRNIQLIRAGAYSLPLLGLFMDHDGWVISGLVVLQLVLGLLQPIYASLSFSLLPEVCGEDRLVEANSLLDGTIRLMGFIAPGTTALLLAFLPMYGIYAMSAFLFLFSYLSLSRIPAAGDKSVPNWTKRFWLAELQEGYRAFFAYPQLVRLTLLSSAVQFAVGAAMVLGVPFIRGELEGRQWEYAIFSGSFPVGYAIGMVLLSRIPKTSLTMYTGLVGGGLSFVALCFVDSISAAWLCELFGGILFPLFNAQSAALFQKKAPRDRLAQLSSVRLLFLRITMPFGILFASAPITNRMAYLIVGLGIVLPGLYYVFGVLRKEKV